MRKRVLRLWAIAALIGLTPASLIAQDRQINGRVIRSGTDQPVQAAAVSVAGGGEATTVLTSADGRFSITVPAGEVTLAVAAFGYAEQQVIVAAGESTVDIELQYDAFKLDELVVTGQATSIERRSATTAISYVSGEDIARVTSPTVLNSLNGKVTGVNLQTNSGAPGGGIQMQIRGNNTILGAYDPLFVVDGVIYSNESIPSGRGFANAAASTTMEADAVNRIADLNPADIESIEILKGAAASSIYGSKASNGVVVIKTARGQIGAPRINVTQRVGVFSPMRTLDARQWSRDEAVEEFGEAAEPFFQGSGTPYFDFYEQVYSNRDVSYETLANVSGGSEATRYYVSAGWKRDEGTELNTGAARQTLRANLDQELGSRVNVSFQSAYSRSENDRGWNNNCNNNGCHGYAFSAIPSFVDLTQKDETGAYPTPTVGPQSNPVQLTELGVNHEETNRFTGSLTLGWDAVDSDEHSLRLVAGGGVDVFNQSNDVWSPPELFFEANQTFPGESIESGGRSQFYNWNVNGVHTWTTFDWSASTSVGLQYEDRRLNTFRIRTQNLLPGQPNVNRGTETTVTEDLSHERTLALYAQEAIRLFDDRFLVQGGLRAERSSANGDVDKYFVFPKVSGSYRFLDVLGAGSEIKLRAAYGETGNQPLFGQKYTTLGTPQFGGRQGYTVSDTSGFAGVEPERVKEIEVGIDGEALNGRLTWELTGFNRNTTNLLLERVPAPSSGFSQQIFNGGKLRNSGFEVGLGVTPVLTGSAQWVARGTFTRYTSEIVDLAGLPGFLPQAAGFGGSLGQTFIEEGRPITQIVGFGLDADGNRTEELMQLGNSAPDFRVGLVNDVSYKALNLNVVLDWQQGGNTINLTQFLYDAEGTAADFGSEAWVERRRHLENGSAEAYVEDATFLKVREVALDLALPQRLTESLFGASDIRLGLSAQNLFMWTKYSGLDPEVANFGAQAVRNNLDITPYPPSRGIFFNVSVGF